MVTQIKYFLKIKEFVLKWTITIREGIQKDRIILYKYFLNSPND